MLKLQSPVAKDVKEVTSFLAIPNYTESYCYGIFKQMEKVDTQVNLIFRERNMKKKALYVNYKDVNDIQLQYIAKKPKNYRSLIFFSILLTIFFKTTTYGIDTPAISIVGQLLNWTVIAVTISLMLTACLALVIVLVDCVFVTLKRVEDFHSSHR